MVQPQHYYTGIPRYLYGHNFRHAGRLTERDRFWSCVEKRGACWVWTGRLHKAGYGILSAGGRRVMAHRYSWELHNGPVPAGLFVCHRCDCPPCVFPVHLFLGTARDNTADMVAKGRHRPASSPGERNPAARLTAEQVLSLRRRWRGGERTADLAREFGVCEGAAYKAASGKTWRHLP